MSVVIFTKDALRASVEAATGGKVTVLYDDKGYPSYMVVIPKFNLQDIDASLGTGVHPAFVVNGVEKSQIYIGQYQAIVADGRAVSMPGKDPAVSLNFDTAFGYCAAKGPGWHLMTNAEWAAIALWCWRNGTMPRGNNNYGRDVSATYETGRRVDGGAPGVTTGAPRTLTGSGPASWRHDHSYAGIADLNGNIYEWVGGMRVNAAEIQILQNNNAADNTKSQAVGSPEWKAILQDGTLVAAGTPNTLKYDGTVANGTGTTNVDTAIDYQSDGTGYTSAKFQDSTYNDTNITVTPGLALLKALGLYPVAATGLGDDYLYVNNSGERLPLRGGGWGSGLNTGVFALNLSSLRSHVDSGIGFRVACVL
jgi:hypothetical protein